MWQEQILDLLDKAVSATKKNEREAVKDLLSKMALLIDVGNRPPLEDI